MTSHIEHDLPIEQLNPLAQREVKVKRALNTAGAFHGRIIKAESIGQSSDELVACRTACGEPAEPPVVSLPNQALTFDSLCGTIAL